MHRELEFLLAWPPDRPEAGGLYLRGYIDCLFRDAQGARYHPLQEGLQKALTARAALGLES